MAGILPRLSHMADARPLAGAVLAGWLGFGSGGYRSWTAGGYHMTRPAAGLVRCLVLRLRRGWWATS